MKLLQIACLTLLLSGQISSVSAEMYRWTDNEGNVVYSQTPPPDGRDVSKIKPPPGPSAEESEAARQKLEQQIQQLNASGEERLKAKEEAMAKKQEAETNRKQCDLARSSLNKLNSTPPNTLYKMGDEYKRFTPEERQEKVKAYEKAIEQYCN